MAEKNTGAAEEKAAETMTRESIVKSQAAYEGNQHSDLVEVKIIKDGDFYKKGDVDQVHPTLALILKEKGLIEGTGRKVERPTFKPGDVTVDA